MKIVDLQMIRNCWLKPSILLVLPLWLSLAMIPACGYHFRATGEPIGIGVTSLAIPLMASPSSSLGFEADFTRIIRDEFISHAKVPLVPRDEAAFILIGEVCEIKTEPLSYSSTQEDVQGKVITYEVTKTRWLKIKLDAKLIDVSSGKLVWEEKAMEGKASFSLGKDPMETRYYQRKAVQRIAQSMAEKIFSKTMDRF